MEQEYTNQESQKNITNKWLDLIFDSLKRLEEYERLATDGCLSLLEYTQINTKLLPQIQLKNLEMMFGEFDRLFENTKEILQKKEYNSMIIQLRLYRYWFYSGTLYKEKKYRVSRIVRDDNKKISFVELLPLFLNVQRGLCKLRGILVSNLSHILYSLDKFKDRKRRET